MRVIVSYIGVGGYWFSVCGSTRHCKWDMSRCMVVASYEVDLKHSIRTSSFKPAAR